MTVLVLPACGVFFCRVHPVLILVNANLPSTAALDLRITATGYVALLDAQFTIASEGVATETLVPVLGAEVPPARTQRRALVRCEVLLVVESSALESPVLCVREAASESPARWRPWTCGGFQIDGVSVCAAAEISAVPRALTVALRDREVVVIGDGFGAAPTLVSIL